MTTEDTKRFYDLTAEATADAWYENAALMPSIREFVSLLPKQPRVLDLGCGPGHESLRLASTGAAVVGIDFSTECIRVARERCPQCLFEVMDFTRLVGERLGRFDGIFAAASLIHVPPADLPAVLDGLTAVLDERGYLLVVLRDGTGVRETRPIVEGEVLRRTVYRYTRDALASAARSYGYVREGFLQGDLLEDGWRSHLLRRA